MAPTNNTTVANQTLNSIPEILRPESEPDLDFKSSMVLNLKVVNSAFILLILIFLVVRIWTRLVVIATKLKLDDYLMIGATLSSIASSCIAFVALTHGLGTHIYSWNVSLSELTSRTINLTKYFLVEATLYCLSITLAKLSVIILYLRVFPVLWLRRALLVIAGIMSINFILTVFIIILQCEPVNAGWDFRVPGRKCLNLQAFFYFSGALNIVTDCIICTLPLPLIWRLGMETRKKIAVSVLFGVGFISCIASIVRLTYINDIKFIDMPYAVAKLMIWSIVEVNVIIMCASVPIIKAFFARMFPRVASYYNGSASFLAHLTRHTHPHHHHQHPLEKYGLGLPSSTSTELTSARPLDGDSSERGGRSRDSKMSTGFQDAVVEVPETVYDPRAKTRRISTEAVEMSTEPHSQSV